MKNIADENRALKDEIKSLKLQIHETAVYQAEKDRLQLEYEKSQSRFRTIFEKSSVAKKITNDQLQIIQVNKSLVRILGYSQDELTGRRITDFSHPDHREHWKNLQKELWTTNLPSFNFDTCLIKKDGTSIWLHITTIIIDDNGGRLGYTILEDISERKELERLKQLVQEQEQRQQIVETILNTQEEERRRMAERLHNGLGQLLYGVKLSLSPVKKTTSPDLIEPVKYTEQLLADCMVECRSIAHDLMPAILMTDGLEQAISSMCSQLSDTVQFKHRLLGLTPRLPAYLEVAIYRMLQEIVMNIIKHARATEANIEIVVYEKEIKLMVTDNGRGFDLTTQKKNGIGMQTIRLKAELLDGTLHIKSAPGEGTTMLITIPKRVD